jgi:hypothetical protein
MTAAINWYEVLIGAGAVCAALTAILVCVGLVVRIPPVRWVWRRLVAEPLGGWFRSLVRAEVSAVRDQLLPNGGASLRDAVDRVETRQVEASDRLSAVETWIRQHGTDDPVDD